MDPELDFVKWIVAPIVPFVSHPGRIAAVALLWFVAAAFVTLRRRKFSWPPTVAGVAWALYALWEQHCVNIGYNIRVDLFLIFPVLAAITLFGLAGVFIANPRHITLPNRFSLRGLLIVTTCLALALGLLVWLSR